MQWCLNAKLHKTKETKIVPFCSLLAICFNIAIKAHAESLTSDQKSTQVAPDGRVAARVPRKGFRARDRCAGIMKQLGEN